MLSHKQLPYLIKLQVKQKGYHVFTSYRYHDKNFHRSYTSPKTPIRDLSLQINSIHIHKPLYQRQTDKCNTLHQTTQENK